MINRIGLPAQATSLVAICEKTKKEGRLWERAIIADLSYKGAEKYVVSRQCAIELDESGEPKWQREWQQGYYTDNLDYAREMFAELCQNDYLHDGDRYYTTKEVCNKLTDLMKKFSSYSETKTINKFDTEEILNSISNIMKNMSGRDFHFKDEINRSLENIEFVFENLKTNDEDEEE